MEVEWPQQETFEEWLLDAARGVGVYSTRKEQFVARFTEEQLRTYYFNFGHFKLVQGPVLQAVLKVLPLQVIVKEKAWCEACWI
jgi:hypothetical protein